LSGLRRPARRDREIGLGAFAVWRKVQSDRAELDLWTEATAADED
jgi:hypothetical protein